MTRNKLPSVIAIFSALIAGLLILVSLSGILIAYNARQRQLSSIRRQAIGQQESQTETLAVALQNEIEGIRNNLLYVAQIDEIKKAEPASCQTKLEELQKTTPLKVGNLGRINRDGIFACSLNKAIIGREGTSFGPYVAEIFNDPEHKPVLSRAISVPGAPSLVVAIHVPVFDNGKFSGTLGGAIYLSDLQKKYLDRAKISDSSSVLLFDDNKDLLYHPNSELIGKNFADPAVVSYYGDDYSKFDQQVTLALSGQNGSLSYMFNDETYISSLRSFTALEKKMWVVSSGQALKALEQNVNQQEIRNLLLRSLLGFGLLVVLSIMVGVAFISRAIIIPLRKISVVAAEVGSGNLEANAQESGPTEISDLGKTFNTMVKKLKDYYSTLQQRVEDRTMQLNEAVRSSESKNRELEDTKLAVLNILEDLNEEKEKIAEEKAKDEALLSSMGEGLLFIDRNGIVQQANPSALNILKVEPKQIIGKSILSALTACDELGNPLPKEKRPISRALSGQSVAQKVFYKLSDDSIVPTFVTATTVKQGKNIIGVVQIFRDITSEYELDKAKDEFVSIASHQLRTPATATKNFIGLLKEGYAGKMTKEQTEYVDRAYDSNERQLGVVNDLLHVARTESGRLVLNLIEANLVELIQNAVDEQKATIDTRQQKVIFETPSKTVNVKYDKDYFRMVVENLLSNAVKYSPEKSTIKIRLAEEANKIKLAVSDEGIGIAKDDLEKLFKKFSRIQNPKSQNVQGTGIGLYLVKNIIILHKGTIDVESELGKGTTFTVTLPK